MSNLNTVKRTLCSLGLLILFAQSAAAQSVLNFSRASHDASSDTGIAVTNPNIYYADVQFTFYGLDGKPVSGVANPVNYRIPPKSQLQMQAGQMFLSGTVEGWIQATSSSPGLIGFYFGGDFVSTEYGAEVSPPLLAQAIPVIREDQASGSHTDLFVDNPQSTNANVTVTLYGPTGIEITTSSQSIPPYGGFNFAALFPSTGLPAATARVTSSIPVTAIAVVNTQGAQMFVTGQALDQVATTRIAPHFVSGSGVSSQLVLANPNSTTANATVTLFSASGGLVYPAAAGPKSIAIPANGLVTLDAASLTGLPIIPAVNGWIQIDSSNLALNGAVVLSSGSSLTAIELQAAGASEMMFSQLSDSDSLYSELDLVNPAAVTASLTISVLRIDGTLVAQKTVPLPAHAKLSSKIPELMPEAAGQVGGFILLQSSAGIFGVEMLGNSQFLTTVVPQNINVNFVPKPAQNLPQILSIQQGLAVQANTTIRMNVSYSGTGVQVLLGGLVLTPLFPTPLANVMDVNVGAIEPGFAKLRLRVGGLESAPITLRILPPNNSSLTDMTGQAFYQKVAVTDSGLELTETSMSPIRNARVEVRDSSTGALVSVTQTDNLGEFTAPVPTNSAVTINVLSRLRSTGLTVADNSNNGALYTLAGNFDARENDHLVIADTSRISGAFNILEMVQHGNDLLQIGNPALVPPTPTIFWSQKNTLGTSNVNGLIGIGTTHFSLAAGTAYILGDRNTDSDEFDDSVIIHEYAHMLAAAFSRDDSPGGIHGIGNMEDPRLAWSEGFANFFSGAARNNSVYLDSLATPSGPTALRIDLEVNVPPGDSAGIWSEGSVGSLLWDMFDAQPDAGDTVQYPFTQIWPAITDLTNYRFVYLPYFLQAFLARYPLEADAVQALAQARSIEFQPFISPSVTNPFPRPMSVGEVINGDEVNSLTSQRTNLAFTSHFYAFTITKGTMLAIRMDITGLGDGNNPNFNDLDLYLMDLNAHVINLSNSGLNGQSEFIAQNLAAGTYVIEVRSYYTNADTKAIVYNSGQYRLSLTSPAFP